MIKNNKFLNSIKNDSYLLYNLLINFTYLGGNMRLVELDEKSLDKCLVENKYVLISVYESDCIISELMEGVLFHVCKNLKEEIIIAVVKKEYMKDYLKNFGEESYIVPELILFKNSKIIDRLPGFRRANQVIDFVHHYV